MTERRAYLATAIRLYLALPDTPRSASRSDWAVAATLYNQGVPLETLAHVFRLATLRRAWPTNGPREPVHSLAYYRRVLDQLTPDALDPGYADYVASAYETIFGQGAQRTTHNALSDRQNPAVSDRR